MDAAPPTFASRWDRVTYLLAEYKWPLLICLAAGGLWAAWATPELPTPPGWTLSFAASAALISFPAFVVAKWVIGWFESDDMVSVGVASPGQTDLYEKYVVPKEVWQAREREGPPAMRPDEGVDWIVTDWEWLDDLEQLRIRGCDRADMQPSEAWADATRVKIWFDHYHELKRQYSGLKARMQDKGTEIHDATIMQMMAVREEAEMAPEVSVTDLIDEMEDETEDIDPPDPMDTFDPLGDDQGDDLGGGGLDEPAEVAGDD